MGVGNRKAELPFGGANLRGVHVFLDGGGVNGEWGLEGT